MILHHKPVKNHWLTENIPPFSELILSWNGKRPREGRYLFYISVKTADWSPWLLYASWGAAGQSSFSHATLDGKVNINQDTLEIKTPSGATGFQIKMIVEGHYSLDLIRSLHVYINDDQRNKNNKKFSCEIYLEMPGLSQMTLNHPRYTDLCSPTSTTAVIRYLSKNFEIDPIHFAQQSWDQEADIFGNWVLNIAQAADLLGEKWNCWVEKLKNFEEICERLIEGIPVITSIRGPLKGGALPYTQGHLIVVVGFDPLHQQVICMDPAFSSDGKTCVFYDLSDFLQAWNRRERVAYIFNKAYSDSELE